MATIDVLGVPHTYEITQSSPAKLALVFVHGWLLSRHYWTPLIQKLAPLHPCVLYDLRGFGSSATGSRTLGSRTLPSVLPRHQPALVAVSEGASGLPAALSQSAALSTLKVDRAVAEAGVYGLPAYAQDLLVLLDQLQLEQVWLVGHSLGGSIALWAAYLNPDRVQGVVCLNAGGGIYLKEEFEKFRTVGEQMLRFRPRWLASLPLLHLLFRHANVAHPVDLCWGRQRVIDFVAADPEAARQALLDSTSSEAVHCLPQIVASLKQPAYFLAGQQDQIMALKYVYHLASFHPLFQAGHANVIELPECGHMAMLEKTDAIAATIQQVVAQHSGA